MATAELLTLNDADRWRARLAASPLGDFYHDPAYLAALSARGEGEPLFFHYADGDGAGFHAVLLRPLAALPFAHPYAAACDAVSPYGYAGPVISRADGAADFWAAWREAARGRGVVAEFVRFHPLLRNHQAFAGCLDVREAGETIWLDLAGDFESGLSASCRRNERLAARRGLVVERAGFDRLPQFWEMYSATMRRKGADDYYFFDLPYFERFRDGFGDDCRLMRAHVDGRDAAYSLCVRHRDFLHYHLSCSDDALAKLKPVDRLLVETARQARAAGLRAFHLGGGYRGRDSLHEFKARFSPLRAGFFVGRAVHDAAAVAHLTALARAAGRAPSDPSFFPPYRSSR
jgi:hypothetical protein